jgi:hypothetical protein
MQGSPQSTPPPWNESDSFRETGLICIDDPDDREAIRRVSRLIYDMSLEVTREPGGDSTVARGELRAAQADLRYLEGYLISVGQESEHSSLEPDEDRLAQFAGKLAGRVGALVASIEEELS